MKGCLRRVEGLMVKGCCLASPKLGLVTLLVNSIDRGGGGQFTKCVERDVKRARQCWGHAPAAV